MSKSTISTFDLFEIFPDAETAREYMEEQRWPRGHICPACDEKSRLYDKGKGYHRCNACSLVFTVRTGTIFERSKIGLHKWIYAMYLFVTDNKGISSVELAKQIGVTQKSAWFVLQRLREACSDDPTQLTGIVEMDEAYIESKRLKQDRGGVRKTAIIVGGMPKEVKQIVDAVTDRVFDYRPSVKGKQAKKLKRKKKRDGQKPGI